MKYLFASDIHGNEVSAQRVKELFVEEKADFLVLCGDIMYHPPKSDVNSEYNPKGVVEIFNSISDKIIAVRGNGDSEVVQMLLDFPMFADYTLIVDEGIKIYVSHGHIYNKENPLKLVKGDFLVCGHTHVLGISEEETFVYLNPGSVAVPMENNPQSYMIYDNKEFIIKDMNGNEIMSYKI